MNNCFLLISTDPSIDEISKDVEAVLRQLMRKFRKGVDFYRINSQFLKTDNENSRDIISGKIKNSDAVILLENKNSNFIKKDYLSIYLQEHYISGKCIIAPVQKDNLNSAIKTAIDCARHKKADITVCTKPSFGDLFLSEIESLGAVKDINFDYFTIHEFLWQYMNRGVFSDVLLTDGESADIITTLFSSQKMFRDGFVRYVGEKCNLYCREILPYDEMTNCAFSGILLACSGAIENELNLPSISAWLRRGVAKVSERCLKSSREEYMKELSRAINERIRSRRTLKNDN